MCAQAQHAAPFNDGVGMLTNYLPVLIFLAHGTRCWRRCCSAWASVLGRCARAIAAMPDKLSPYECGFEAFEDTA